MARGNSDADANIGKAMQVEFSQLSCRSSDSSSGEQSPRHHQHLWAHGHKVVGQASFHLEYHSRGDPHHSQTDLHQNRLGTRSQSDKERSQPRERINRKVVLKKSHRSWPSGGTAARR